MNSWSAAVVNPPNNPVTVKLIIDTDPGVDDAIAIALAHALPEIDLLGLTTVFGNTFVHQSSRNARFLLDQLGLDIPVAEGASLPWGATRYEPSANVHGPEGFGDITDIPEIGTNADQPAADFLSDMARTHSGELVLCAIGPLTNVADTLRRDPDFATYLKQLVIMGGAFEVPGNITPKAEANIFHDAAAADYVFASGIPVTMVGLNATLQTLLTRAQFQSLAREAPHIGALLERMSGFYLDFYRSFGLPDGCPMHDAAAVLACAFPDRLTYTQSGLHVPLSGDQTGATLPAPARPLVRIATGIEADWAITLLQARIAALG